MTDFTKEIQGRVAALDERINRLHAETESAECERSDLQIALRVYADISGTKPVPMKIVEAVGSTSAPAAPRPSAEKKRLIRNLMGYGRENGRSPSQVHKGLLAQNVKDIPIQQVRTIMWRLNKHEQDVAGDDGRYWLIKSDPTELEFVMRE